MCEDDCIEYNEDESLYYEFGEGYEDELLGQEEQKEDEVIDETILNSKEIHKFQLDDYFIED